jgi:hypothetical protein
MEVAMVAARSIWSFFVKRSFGRKYLAGNVFRSRLTIGALIAM